MKEGSQLAVQRNKYIPKVPKNLKNLNRVQFTSTNQKISLADEIKELFPHTSSQSPYILKEKEVSSPPLKIGVVFSGGQAPGGHNVIAALFDALKQIHSKSILIGFLDGPSGVIENRWKELKKAEIDPYRNLGGFDLIGSGRTKIETEEQLQKASQSCRENQLDGLLIIGGDDSNTNAAILAEYFAANQLKTRVVGVPKTIDGDLKSKDIEISFGFDSATKTYAEIIGNIEKDALSAKKYYHFIKLMGRSASHIALECALQTKPNLTLISEEKKRLKEIVNEIVTLIVRRSHEKKDYGVILIPEGIIEFMPEIRTLISELNQILSQGKSVLENLTEESKKLFQELPEKIQRQLTMERDPHGNVQVSKIETEKLFLELVKKELKNCPDYKGKFNAQEHFLGYEGRACFPTNFDANYCSLLGIFAALAIRDGLTGVIGAIQNLTKPVDEWSIKAIPIVQMLHLELRHGKEKPVIEKALVDIKGKAYVYFSAHRKGWMIEDQYSYPGPIQFYGDEELTDSIPLSLLR